MTDESNRQLRVTVLMHAVDSSAISHMGYNHEEKMLLVHFHHQNSETCHVFMDVPYEVFQDFMKAESKGKYFNTYVKGLFESHLVPMIVHLPEA